MTNPARARFSRAAHSLALGAKDPRPGRNARGGLTDNELGTAFQQLDGKLRLKALDGQLPVASTASLADLIAAHNRMLQALKV